MPVPPGTDPADARMLAVQQPTLQISGFEAQQLPLRRVIFLRNLQLEEAAPVLGVPIQAGQDGLTTVHAMDRDDTTARQRETFAGRIWQRGPNLRACPDSHPISTTDRELGILVITHMGAIGSAAAQAPPVGSGTVSPLHNLHDTALIARGEAKIQEHLLDPLCRPRLTPQCRTTDADELILAAKLGKTTEGLDGIRVSRIEHAPASKQSSRHADSSTHVRQVPGFIPRWPGLTLYHDNVCCEGDTGTPVPQGAPYGSRGSVGRSCPRPGPATARSSSARSLEHSFQRRATSRSRTMPRYRCKHGGVRACDSARR